VLAARGVSDPTPALIAATRRQLGLSGPVVPRYWHWLERALHGDFGTSWQTGRPVMEEFAARLPATARLTLTAMLIATALALVLGLASAATAGTWIDSVLRTVTVLMVVTPGFLIGLFVLDILVVHLNLGRVVSDGSWSTVGWPAVTLAIGAAGFWARVLRVENNNPRSQYPRTVYATVFEFAGLLWFYTETDGTQSFSLHRGMLAGEKADFRPLLRDIDPGFAAFEVLPDSDPLFARSAEALPNGCFIESVAALHASLERGERIQGAALLSYYIESGGRMHGHTVLAYETPAGLRVVDSAQSRL